MNNISLNDSLFFNAALEASKTEAKKQSELKSKKTEKNVSVKTFSQILETAEDQVQNENEILEIKGMSFEQAEQFLIDNVYSAGDLLKQAPVSENFVAYKKAVGNFLKFVQEQCYEVEEVKGIAKKVKGKVRTITKQKSYTLVKVVNEKLEALASDILFNQRDQIKMTAKINEISGLLIDVFY